MKGDAMQIKDLQIILTQPTDNDPIFELAPGEYWAWVYNNDPSSLFETRVLVLEDPTPDDDEHAGYLPSVFLWQDGQFRDITLSLATVYAVRKISRE